MDNLNVNKEENNEESKEFVQQGLDSGILEKTEDELTITKRGLDETVQYMGGQDIVNLCRAFTQKLINEGCIGFPAGSNKLDNFFVFSILQDILYTVKNRFGNSADWKVFVSEMEIKYISEDFFEKNPHAFL